VWEVACWQVGAVVDVTPGAQADVVVCGPDDANAMAAAEKAGSTTVLACSLQPFATGIRGLPVGVVDYDLTVRAHPDQHMLVRQSATGPAWVDGARTLSQVELTTAVVDRPASRRLVRPSEPWVTARDGILAALGSGGSVVVVVGDDEDALDRIRATERAC
jgi:uncharacterized protein (TIGR03089 family)